MPDQTSPSPQPVPCPKCNGCGKLDSKQQRPWSRYLGMPSDHPEHRAILSGDVLTILCPDCAGTGTVDSQPTPNPKTS